ncbi:MAG: ROK family transcriptional regulator [Chloroflexi bacterium]|nr:ROK family transcriptional regulator [Chloroflexota bacterium]
MDQETNTFLTADLRFLRQINRLAVLDVVRQRGPISRTDISRVIKLTPATSFTIVDELVKMGLLRPQGIGSSTGGRRPTLFEFNPTAFFVLGVDIGGLGKMIAVLADLDGNVLARAASELAVGEGPAGVIARIVASLKQVILEAGVERHALRGVGIATPGLADPRTGRIIYSANLGWQDIAIADPVEQAMGLPTWVENNANAMALGESWCGAGRGFQNVICLNVGVGIGAGIVIRGKLYRGSGGLAGEIGHTTVDEDGPRCRCGNHGCLEALAAGPAIARRAVRGIRRGTVTRIADLVQGKLEYVTAEVVSQAAALGDPFALQILEEAGQYVGLGVANLINSLNPDVVVIGGGVAQAGEVFFAGVRRAVAARALQLSAAQARIVPAKLGMDAGAVGATTLVLERSLAS